MSNSADPFAGVFSHGPVAALVDGNAWTQAMLDFEAGLARACATVGLIPDEAAAAITAVCRVDQFDVAAIGHEAAAGGNPAIPLIAALRRKLPTELAAYAHRGATSQDVIDTAMMLVARRAVTVILADAARVATSAAGLARRHRQTVMHGRTLLQQAVPVTFGLKAAGWLTAVDHARAALARAAAQEPAVQFGGAAGTLASLGENGLAVAQALADELELPLAPLPWHTDRTRLAALAAPLAALVGSLGKVARDIELLAQNEVAEVTTGSSGGSSAMPHKRNPVQAVAVVACALRTPAPLATLHATMLHEHERAAGAWHAEWEPLSELLRLAGAATSWSAELLAGLQVDAARMRANLDAAGDIVMAESVVAALARSGARELVDGAVERAVAENRSLRDTLLATPDFPLPEGELDAALEPAAYLGATDAFITRALAAYEHDEES